MRASILPPRLSLEALGAQLSSPDARPYLWCSAALRGRLEGLIPATVVGELAEVPEQATHLVAVGGGTRLDRAKAWRADRRPRLWLCAIPSLYGSGAEASPVVVRNGEQDKGIRIGEEFLADARVVVPELLRAVPDALLRAGTGDILSHAFEAFLSPLADASLRAEAAAVLGAALELEDLRTAAWFELGAEACALQARASVGLVHGIAHRLEPQLRGEVAASGFAFGHAGLCALFLWPVLSFDRSHSPKAADCASEAGLDLDALELRARELFEPEDYALVRVHLERNWRSILRDPCTRTNGVLVRPGHLDFFLEESFR